jgi:hypothetical protein
MILKFVLGWDCLMLTINLATNLEQASIFASIRNYERGHNHIFRGIFRVITGEEITGIPRIFALPYFVRLLKNIISSCDNYLLATIQTIPLELLRKS